MAGLKAAPPRGSNLRRQLPSRAVADVVAESFQYSRGFAVEIPISVATAIFEVFSRTLSIANPDPACQQVKFRRGNISNSRAARGSMTTEVRPSLSDTCRSLRFRPETIVSHARQNAAPTESRGGKRCVHWPLFRHFVHRQRSSILSIHEILRSKHGDRD